MEIKYNDISPNVAFWQTILKSLNVYDGKIDKIFGTATLNAVKKIQEKLNLKATGKLDDITINELLPYIFVPTDIEYTSYIVDIIIRALAKKYSFIQTYPIGYSVLEKNIYCLKIGSGKTNVLYVAATHANEWITTPVMLKFIEEYCKSYVNGENIYNTSSSNLFNNFTLHFVPLLNPDGVDLVNGGLSIKSKEYISAIEIAKNYPAIPFPSGWKANILGIDLNLQFPAYWEKAKEIKFKQGFVAYAPRDFVGNFALETPEAIAIYDYTINNNFKMMLTFHTQGEVIYWKFLDYMPQNAEYIGKEISKASGYVLETTPYASGYAGFKDWYIFHYNLPGYTIECGKGINPLPLSEFNDIYTSCAKIFVTSTIAYENANKNNS